MDDTKLVALLARSGQGDRSAFKELYDATAGTLLGVAMQLLRERSRAEDALQDAYIQIWHKASEYNVQRGSVLGWLATIVRYRAIDMQRRDARLQTGASLPEMVDPQLSAEQLSAALEQASELKECMDRLSQSQRQSIALAFFEGLTHDQLAVHLTAPLGTIKSRIRRGLTRLKECLDV